MSFGIGEKKTSNTTTNQTTNTYTDKSANAGGDGSFAVGEGGSLSINTQDLSEGVAREAIRAGVDQSAYAIGGNTAVATASIAAGTRQTEFVVNTLESISEVAARENQDTRNSADLALKTSAGLTNQLQETTAAALQRAQSPEATSIATIIKPVLLALGAVVLIIFFFTRQRGNHK